MGSDEDKVEELIAASSLCSLRVLCAFVVDLGERNTTTETQRTQGLRRDI